MAWKARSSFDIDLLEDLTFQVVVQYYDDADPANANVSPTVPPARVLHTKTFFFAWGITTADLQKLVVEEGQRSRLAYTQLQAARTAVPAGSIVAIP